MISRIIKVEVRVIRQTPRLQGFQIEKNVAGGNCKKNETEKTKTKQRNWHIYFELAQKLKFFGPTLKYGYSLAKLLLKRHP